MFQHGVEYGQQFAHTRDQRQFLGLSGCQQPLVEVPDGRVVTAGYQGSHVEDGPHRERPPQTARLPRRAPLSRL